MMKKTIIGVCVLCLVASVSLAFGRAPEKAAPEAKTPVKTTFAQSGSFIIDDFESGNLQSPRNWWTFDIETAEPVANNGLTIGDKDVVGEIGNYSLKLNGLATNWYAGGAGTYYAKENQDLSKYDAMQIDIYGNGPGSGTLKIELFDDDNKNWQVEQDPAKAYAPIYDDKLVYITTIDWAGWKRLVIPFDDFVDDNDEVGDDIWNPAQANGSGGLLQVQFICIGAKDSATVNYNLDNVKLIVEE